MTTPLPTWNVEVQAKVRARDEEHAYNLVRAVLGEESAGDTGSKFAGAWLGYDILDEAATKEV